jgi:Fe-S cluster assembly protein SufD
MQLLEDRKDTFLRQFDELDRKRKPRHYELQRRLGRGLFGDLSFPSGRAEDWRFTNVAPLLRLPFTLADATRLSVPLPPLSTPNAIRLVFVNGLFAPEQSRLPSASTLAVGSLAQPHPDHLRQIESLLGQVADPSDHIFTALNAGLVSDGAYVLAPAGLAFSEPIEVIYVSSAGDRPAASYPRTLVFAGRGSQARIVERYLGRPDSVYLTNAVTEILVEEGAHVDHYKVQDESRAGNHLANTQVVQKRDSSFTSHYIARGGALVRNETRVRFDGQGCTATINGLYVGKGKQHLDNFTVIDHAQPHCASHELYKGLLDGEAHGVFSGKILVRPDAQKTDAKQTNKVLLLSDKAVINTKPQLEIFADDVKCTHGATIGQLDATQLFYLRARGIPLDEARRILMFAFANDIVSRIQVESLRQELEDWLVG